MKTFKLFFVALVLHFVGSSAFAQIGKGKSALSGNIMFQTTNNSGSSSSQESDYFNLDIKPTYGYFFGEKVEAGISIGYSWRTEKHTSPDLYYGYNYSTESTTGLFLAGPYARFYQNLAERFYFDFSVVATFFTGSQEITDHNSYYYPYPYPTTVKTEHSIFEYQVGIAPGLVYFFNNHWATNISLGVLQYDSYKLTRKQADKSTTTGTFTGGINAGGLGFGIGFYF